MKKIKLDGNGWFFLVAVPIVAAIVWINYGYKVVIGVSIFFIALYIYYLMFLNIIYAVKDKTLRPFRDKVIMFSIASIVIFIFSTISYGFNISLPPLVVISIVSITQAIIVLTKK